LQYDLAEVVEGRGEDFVDVVRFYFEMFRIEFGEIVAGSDVVDGGEDGGGSDRFVLDETWWRTFATAVDGRSGWCEFGMGAADVSGADGCVDWLWRNDQPNCGGFEAVSAACESGSGG